MKKFPLVLSSRLKNVLGLIDHQISFDLLKLNGVGDLLVSQTFIDIDTDSSSISFIQSNKASQILGITESDMESDHYLNGLNNFTLEDKVYTKYRSKTKIGRFLNTNFPNKYEISLNGSSNSSDIESFVNMYKAIIDRDIKFNLMDVVKGDDIAKWYNYHNYKHVDNGSLGNSCMKSVDSNYFDIYSKNPEKVSLVILYTDLKKENIKGRAILWDLDQPVNRSFMDRIYTSNYSDEQIFKDYAIKNNWLYKSDQSIGSKIPVHDPSVKGDPKEMDLISTLSLIDHKKFPYCDTMAYYNHNNGIISNGVKFGATMNFHSTYGSYNNIETIYSKYYNSTISKSSAVYCLYGDDYVYNTDAVKVYNTGSESVVYSVPNCDEVVKMEFKVSGSKIISKHFLKNRCIFSEYLNTWVFENSVVLVWDNINKETRVIEHLKRLNYNYTEIDGEYYLNSLISKKTGKLKRTYNKNI